MTKLDVDRPETLGTIEDWKHDMRMRKIQAEREAKKKTSEELLARIAENTQRPVRRSELSISERCRLIAEIGEARYLALPY